MITIYWMIPIVHNDPLTLGRERISLQVTEATASFRHKITALHPRLLPMFKANLLLSDDPDLCGGIDIPDLQLMEYHNHDIILQAPALPISHCAEAFFDRLLKPDEAVRILESTSQSWSSEEEHTISVMLSWYRNGYTVFLLAE